MAVWLFVNVNTSFLLGRCVFQTILVWSVRGREEAEDIVWDEAQGVLSVASFVRANSLQTGQGHTATLCCLWVQSEVGTCSGQCAGITTLCNFKTSFT